MSLAILFILLIINCLLFSNKSYPDLSLPILFFSFCYILTRKDFEIRMTNMAPLRIPTSTYRLQFNYQFTIQQAIQLVPYFYELGISDIYASPIMKSNTGSLHGYDVTNCNKINPEIGTEKDLNELVKSLHHYNMGLIVDIIPNHMGIGVDNQWWQDVLEKGPNSAYSHYFNINWNTPHHELKNRIFLPVLDQDLETTLKKHKIKIIYEAPSFFIEYETQCFPINLDGQRLIQSSQNHLEFCQNSDFIKKLLDLQFYQLGFWQEANQKINYGRFFEINSLASMRVEQEDVFETMHQLILKYLKRGWVTGLRIDHVDGLFDPQRYFERLQNAISTELHDNPIRGKDFYIIVEKILGEHEHLRSDWPVFGTTGYDYLNRLNGVFVCTKNRQKLEAYYSNFIGWKTSLSHVIYESKKLILKESMSSELHFLANFIFEISQDQEKKSYTLEEFQFVLQEIIACFPVYRTYTKMDDCEVYPEDRLHIETALQQAKLRNPSTLFDAFNYLENVLLLNDPSHLTDEERMNRRLFVCRFQQLTGPVMAKGVEDTAFYRYYPLASLNEVGMDPNHFGISLQSFHKKNQEILQQWPATLSATFTHDTKRSEDVRARINVLSEIPDEWNEALLRWHHLNNRHKTKHDQREVPDNNEEYLIYQTLIGTWPLYPMNPEEHVIYVDRIQKYLVKALKEAKIHTSWINPNSTYENEVQDFIKGILRQGEDNEFLKDFVSFIQPIIKAGFLNSLSQIVLKMTTPGIPDFFQGSELWELSLVDPDNRHVVDYSRRISLLKSLNLNELDQWIENLEDGRLKLFMIQKILTFRREHPALFREGSYAPIESKGKMAPHIVAFSRKENEIQIIVVVGRFYLQLLDRPINSWDDTVLEISSGLIGDYKEIFTGQNIQLTKETPLTQIFSKLPFAILKMSMK